MKKKKRAVTLDDLSPWAQKQALDQIAICPTYLEQSSLPLPPRPHEIKTFDAPVIISVHSRRKRLSDPDGICFKWVLDSIVAERILRDDSPKEIAEIRFTQEKSKSEETLIFIEEFDGAAQDNCKS